MKIDLSSQELQESINASLIAEVRTWVQIGQIVDQADQIGFWRGKASSYTEWLKNFASELNLSSLTLWRYRAAVRFFVKMEEKLRSNEVECPELIQLPKCVTADNLEILEKIYRVAPEDVLINLSKNVLTGSISRSELRTIWGEYKKALDGKTARGYGSIEPRVDSRNQLMVKEAQIFSALIESVTVWSGFQNPHTFKIFREFVVGKTKNSSTIRVDAAAFIKQGKVDKLDFHIFEIKANPMSSRVLDSVQQYFENEKTLCDFFWLVVGNYAELSFNPDISDEVGILCFENNQIRVIKEARRLKAEDKANMALVFLEKLF